MKKIKLSDNFVNILTGLLILVFPLFYLNYYFNIAFAKYVIFVIMGAAIFFMGICQTIVMHPNTNKVKSAKNTAQRVPWFSKLSVADWAVAAWVVISTISSLASEWRRFSIQGEKGDYTGLVFIYVAAALYYGLSRQLQFTRWIKMCFPLALILESLMAVLQVCGFDILHFYKNIAPAQQQIFIGTIGNINIFGIFTSVYFAVCLYLFCCGACPYLYGTAVFFGFLDLFAANSDGCYLAMGACMAMMMIIAMKKGEWLKRYALSVLLFAAAILLWKLMEAVFSGHMWKQSDVNRLFVSWQVMAVMIVLSVELLLAAVYSSKRDGVLLRRLRIAAVAALAVLAAAYVAVCVYVTFIKPDLDIGDLKYYFRWNLEWGNNRGYGWYWALASVFSDSLKVMLIGSGPGTAMFLYVKHFGAVMEPTLGVTFYSPHNEYIYYLTTAGMIGLLIYLLFVVSSVRRCIKNREKDEMYGALALAILVYMVSSFVNVTQIVTLPYIYILLAMANVHKDF